MKLIIFFIRNFKGYTFLLVSLALLPWIKHWHEMRVYRIKNQRILEYRTEKEDFIPFPKKIKNSATKQENLYNKQPVNAIPFPPKIKFDALPACKRKETNIAFLKTHKTASSTFTSILNRFADLHRLDIALPKGDTRFMWPQPFFRKYVDMSRLKDKRVNVITNHAVLNRPEFYKVMHSPFRLVTILRDPVSQFYSAFYYCNFTRLYGLFNYTNPAAQFIDRPEDHFRTYLARKSHRVFQDEIMLENSQTHDLNLKRFQARQVNNTLTHFIEYLDNAFSFVMIAEYFDEGVIILKKLFCWSYLDFVYEKKLVNKKRKYTPSEDTKQKIRAWNYKDVQLYDYFKSKFLKIKNSFNQEKFDDELYKFQTLNTMVSEYCQSYAKSTHGRTQEFLVKKRELVNYMREIREEVPFVLTNKPNCFCRKVHRTEKEYLRYFESVYPPYHYLLKKKQDDEFC